MISLLDIKMQTRSCYHAKSKVCSYCQSQLEIKEGVMIYDKKWFHNHCWESFEKQNGDLV